MKEKKISIIKEEKENDHLVDGDIKDLNQYNDDQYKNNDIINIENDNEEDDDEEDKFKKKNKRKRKASN